ncbi:uncharacterized protein F5147DRAFT_770039 [Suillus discolor]|uniref:Uncharacterized protein n=1 Tax=Suillus discolor TaxID=1912936 RepID=A0A9P7FFR3_9AGAM|nr:uncharacterized protein F5147DRAFT_770039 [Suillus discolor]KAG2114726.1 hypothetical protein F5147DRAFT_770039 [Suillus discolor]
MVIQSMAKTKWVRTKLTTVQKSACHEKFKNLTNALTTAKDVYQEEAQTVAQEYGRLVEAISTTCLKVQFDAQLMLNTSPVIPYVKRCGNNNLAGWQEKVGSS